MYAPEHGHSTRRRTFVPAGTPGPRVVLIGDIEGPSHYHAGEEAMLAANLSWLRRELRGLTVLLLSEDPGFSEAAYASEALQEPPRMRRLRSPARVGRALWRLRLLARIGATLRCPLPRWVELQWRCAQAIRGADLVFLSGGGNLTSLFPTELRLRSFCALAAQAFGVPVVATGQTLGPALDPADRRLLRAWLGSVVYLGLRDPDASPRLAAELGVPTSRVRVAPDDIYLLEGVTPREPVAHLAQGSAASPLVGVSVHLARTSLRDRADPLRQLAQALDAMAASSGSRFLLLPHETANGAGHDVEVGRRLQSRMAEGRRLIVPDRLVPYEELHDLTARCDLVVATRYHALVFALSSSVPCVGLHQDEYTRIKITGAFRTIGAPVTATSIAGDDLAQLVRTVWSRRADIKHDLSALNRRAMARIREQREELAQIIRSVLPHCPG